MEDKNTIDELEEMVEKLQAQLDEFNKSENVEDFKKWMVAAEDATVAGIPGISTSDVIRQRIKDDGGKFFSNDNISKYIKDDELDDLQAELETKMIDVLGSLVIDTANDHNTQDTARRVAKMFIHETFGGRYKPEPNVTAFPNAAGYDGLYCTGPISIRSTCAHHLQNIVGKCYIGVIPGENVIGLSKFNRIVHWIAERPQIQEEMTMQIADKLEEVAQTKDIAVVVKAEHHCMTHRGVREHESDMTTPILRGSFKNDPALRQEFYSIINNMK